MTPERALQLTVPPAMLEAVAERAAAIVLERLAELEVTTERSPWLTGAAAAAEYLGWPTERVYKKLRDVPHHRHGSRLMFRRDELDAYIAGGG